MNGAAIARRDEIGEGVPPVCKALHRACIRRRKQGRAVEPVGLRFGAARP